MRLSRHLLVSVACLPFAGLAGAQSALPATMVQRIDSVFRNYDRKTSPGCAVSVIRDGQSIFEKGYGMSDLQHDIPIAPNSIFHVASISKQFTAMSVALLARDGKLSLDDDIRKYLPEVPDFGQRITIRQLIHHTSGLRDQWSLLALSGWRPDDPKSEADILWLVGRQKALNFAPGSEHLYSNTGYTLLGTIVHRVTGKTLRQFTEERIFKPLGMNDTHFHDDHSMIVPRRTSAYNPRGAEGFSISIPVFDNAGATSLFTTVQDMAKWERNFLNPTVGDAALIQQMYERGKLTDGTTIAYAFALTHGQVRGMPTIGHGGADAGYRADFVRFPEERHAFATMCNIATANPGALNRSVAEIVLGERMQPVQAGNAAAARLVEVPLDPGVVKSYAGVYVDRKTDEVRPVSYRDSTRTLHPGSTTSPPLIHVGNNVFAVVSPNGQVVRHKFSATTVTDLQTNVVYERVPAASTAPDKLKEYAGRYRSEELDVEWTVTTNAQGVVSLERRRTPTGRMTPAYADGFNSPLGTMRFTRDSSGRVNGFLLTAGRVRHIRFDRVR